MIRCQSSGQATDVAIVRPKTGGTATWAQRMSNRHEGMRTRPNERGSAASLGRRVWLAADRVMQFVGQPCDLLGQPRVLREHLEVLLGHCALAR